MYGKMSFFYIIDNSVKYIEFLFFCGFRMCYCSIIENDLV